TVVIVVGGGDSLAVGSDAGLERAVGAVVVDDVVRIALGIGEDPVGQLAGAVVLVRVGPLGAGRVGPYQVAVGVIVELDVGRLSLGGDDGLARRLAVGAVLGGRDLSIGIRLRGLFQRAVLVVAVIDRGGSTRARRRRLQELSVLVVAIVLGG